MIFKYYTADLIAMNGKKLEAASITIRVGLFRNPVNVVDMMKNLLLEGGYTNHRIINLRRIK